MLVSLHVTMKPYQSKIMLSGSMQCHVSWIVFTRMELGIQYLCPKGREALPYKWVYNYQYTSNSALLKYKVRIVAKSFKQEQGVDFDEIFSPVAKTTMLRIMLVLVLKRILKLFEMNVKITFFHGDLDEEIYMEQSKGYEVHGKMSLVWKVNKSLYGLKQSPPKWYNLMLLWGPKVIIGAMKPHAYIWRNV